MHPVIASDARVLIGAYALGAPDDPGAWREGLAALDVDGVEHPLAPRDAADEPGPWFAEDWDVLVTCIPVVMTRLAADPRYGLASTDGDGRAAAVHDVRRALALGRRLADRSGRRRVVGVEVQSSPGPLLGSPDALSRSLAELLDEDRTGAELVVEHCDRLVPGQAAAKGFLPLEDEIGAVHAVVGDDVSAGIGIGLNWGRSAIEGRSPALPVSHARVAAADGLLRSAVLSGASDRAGLWGAPWTDAHIPPRGSAPALAPARDSLLGLDEAVRFLRAAGPVPLVGAKVAVRPAGMPTAALLEVAAAVVDLTRAAVQASRA